MKKIFFSLKNNPEIYLLLFFIIYGLFIRIYKITEIPNLTQEEVGTIMLVSELLGISHYGLNIEKSFDWYNKGTKYSIQPVNLIFVKLFGLRGIILVSLVFSLIGILIYYFILKLFFDFTPIFYCLTLILILPFHIFWSRIAPSYIFYLTINLITVYLFSKFIYNKKFFLLIIPIILALLMVWSHILNLLFYFAFVPFWGYFFWKKYNKIFKQATIIYFISAMLSFSIIFGILSSKSLLQILYLLSHFNLEIFNKILFRFCNQTIFIIDILSGRNGFRYFVGNVFENNYVILVVLINFILILFAIYHSNKYKKIILLCLLSCLIITYLPLFKNYIFLSHYKERYFLIILPFYITALGLTFDFYISNLKFLYRVIGITIFVINIIYYFFSFNYYYFYTIDKTGHSYKSSFRINGFSRREPYSEYGAWEFFRNKNNGSLLDDVHKYIIKDSIVNNKPVAILSSYFGEYHSAVYLIDNKINNVKLFSGKLAKDMAFRIQIPYFDYNDWIKNYKNYTLYIIELAENTHYLGSIWMLDFPPSIADYIKKNKLLKEFYDNQNIKRYNLYKVEFNNIIGNRKESVAG